MADSDLKTTILRRRLLQDIAELQGDPYPGIAFHFQDEDGLVQACLVLTPEGEKPLHLTVDFPDTYPLEAPLVKIQSKVAHPNVFDDYICASILNTREGYTSAYTLKGIAIQLLSFFSSDKIDQMHSRGAVDRKEWERVMTEGLRLTDDFVCQKCGFGTPSEISMDATSSAVIEDGATFNITALPDDLLLTLSDHLDDDDLFRLSQAWDKFAGLIKKYNVIRRRELKCFTLKEDFNQTSLGIGVHTQGKNISSEFDMISWLAFFKLRVRNSVQGLEFEHWLPLPLSQKHWHKVKGSIDTHLSPIAQLVGVQGSPVNMLYAFMSDIAVRLSKEVSDLGSGRVTQYWLENRPQKSSLSVVSEKAIESYFQLYHLLLCLAAERPKVVEHVNRTITAFLNGETDKKAVPNLGHLLVMMLISDDDSTKALTKAIVKEAIRRNVVWMLDVKGAGMAELSFMETDAISEYRIQKTFDAGKTSYRLLMFANLMKQTVMQMATVNGARLTRDQVRDALFDRHGAPPEGAAAQLANSVKQIQEVSDFAQFLKHMGYGNEMPSKSEFTAFLRRTVHESVDKGYSRWVLTQEEALYLRLQRESKVGYVGDMVPKRTQLRGHIFFPDDRWNDRWNAERRRWR
jgi:ubiquitin-protein ligase